MTNPTTPRIIGIDPGTNILGFAAIEIHNKQIHLLDIGVLHLAHLDNHPDKLKTIFERVLELTKRWQPLCVAIEEPFYGKNIQSMLKLGRAQGVAIAAAMVAGAPIAEYQPRSVKQAVAGKGNASKEQVAAMLQYQLGVALTDHLADATDALAVALCHYHRAMGSGTSTPRKNYSNWNAFLKENPDKLASKTK